MDEFLRTIDPMCKTQLDRALALLWHAGKNDPRNGLTAKEIADLLRASGHPQQNVSRLDSSLRGDRRTAATGSGGWFLRPAARRSLDETYGSLCSSRTIPPSDAVIARVLVAGTRGYIERVVEQINASFDLGLYDCCAVMCRRLVETLIIEIYEEKGRELEIKAENGHYLGLAELVTQVSKDPRFSLSKAGALALKDVKRLGDLSAHNRRYNARKSDIEQVKDGIRLLVEELLHMAALYTRAADRSPR